MNPIKGWRGWAVAVSFSALVNVDLVSDLSMLQEASYLREDSPSLSFAGTVTAAVALLSLPVWAALALTRFAAGQVLFLCAFFYSAAGAVLPVWKSLCSQLTGQPEALAALRGGILTVQGILLRTSPEAFATLTFATAVMILSTLIWQRGRVFGAAIRFLLVISPTYPIVLATVSFQSWQDVRPINRAEKSETPANARRLILLIFDEMDQRLAFEERSAGLMLPALDRLRAESIEFTNAIQAGSNTMDAIPAILTGAPVESPRATGPRTLLFLQNGQTARLGQADDLIAATRRLSVSSGIAGWHHPYCRISTWNLEYCSWVESCTGDLYCFTSGPGGHGVTGLWSWVRDLEARWTHWREHQRSTVNRYTAIAMPAVRDPSLGLLILHVPLPHPPGIGNMRTYAENLELADRFWASTRRILEETGQWEKVTVLVTSDHAFRPEVWKRYSRDADRHLVSGPLSDRIPLLVSLPGYRRHIRTESRFRATRLRWLIEELLADRIRTSAEVLSWTQGSTDIMSPGTPAPQ